MISVVCEDSGRDMGDSGHRGDSGHHGRQSDTGHSETPLVCRTWNCKFANTVPAHRCLISKNGSQVVAHVLESFERNAVSLAMVCAWIILKRSSPRRRQTTSSAWLPVRRFTTSLRAGGRPPPATVSASPRMHRAVLRRCGQRCGGWRRRDETSLLPPARGDCPAPRSA